MPPKSMVPAAVEKAGGLDWLLGEIREGRGKRSLAAELGLKPSTLLLWLRSDPDRSARADAAWAESAEMFDEEALEVLRTEEDVQRAREIASHLRWRSKTRQPQRYGDRQTVDLNATVAAMDTDELMREIAKLQAQLGAATPQED